MEPLSKCKQNHQGQSVSYQKIFKTKFKKCQKINFNHSMDLNGTYMANIVLKVYTEPPKRDHS